MGKKRIQIYDVTLRDGFQGLKYPIPTDAKVHMAGMLAEAGFPYIELGSFISEKTGQMYKNMKDTGEVLRQVKDTEGPRYSALVPTKKYLKKALESGFRDVAVVISANEEHNQRNLRRPITNSLFDINKIKKDAKGEGVRVRAYITTAFGYKRPRDVPIQTLHYICSHVTASEVPEWVDFSYVDEVSLADTFGRARHDDIRYRLRLLTTNSRIGIIPSRMALHFHQALSKAPDD